MDIEAVREYCLAKPGVEETFPFDQDVMVFKVGGRKMFLLISLSNPEYMMVKCDPELAIEWRERYPDQVEGAFHMNKRHWNGVYLSGGRLTDKQLREMIDHSYGLVVRSLPRQVRAALVG